MFAYPSFMYDPSFIYEPRSSSSFYPRTRNYPCSYYHNNRNPFYNQPESFNYFTPRNYFPYDKEEEQFLRKQQEREREQELERSKRFYDNKTKQQAKQSGASTFNTNYQPKKSYKVKIQSDEDEAKAKINKSRAAHKIYEFIKNQSANKRTRKILNKLYLLHKFENDLKEIQNSRHLGNLTFNKENGKQILPISIENKQFLEYEDKIVKLFDKLDGVQSEGADIIRERRKFLVKFAQSLLDELDIEKETQWKAFNENQLNSITDDEEEIDVSMSTESEENEITTNDSAPMVEEGNENSHNSIEPIINTTFKEEL
ncbi:hypothetical protein RclHR1_03730001 [Rhizophagus clarus]|uniref:BAG domain-containing protein n=1 Tax=Rhizophagus clarus TaxID=94130 RepID=A0A2Z6RU15_9GLOM|nr:hypothetical protein RclHR1_03730001 [Rhizophagus clarus]GES93411.1 hypothetical protein GLOIN_2v1560141 [Rhizophagus clarus]